MHRLAWKTLPFTWFLLLAACGGDGAEGEPPGGPSDGGLTDVVVTHPDLPPVDGSDTCTIETADWTPDSAQHVPVCTPLQYATNPPAGGAHYPYWAEFGVYTSPVPHGYLVHDLEHGAVVLSWNCADGCSEVPAALASIAAAMPQDPLCDEAVRTRMIVVPDPDLDVPIAAAAWGHLYRATCLDVPGLTAWVRAHYGQSPETLCAQGISVRAPDGGALDLCSDAGEAGAPADASMDGPG